MKILNVRFKNLNSLAGEWNIDFTDDKYVSEGLFAITGPTGAGKTTILDAICLALFGKTPRLNTVSKSANDIMTRHTSECFAEVEFETIHGRFRTHWSQRRARDKATGTLQQANHEISRADSGEVLADKIKDVASEIERVSGMDYDRFTRSMMLSQGRFAEFLMAGPNERAPILEQITGTQIYSDISIGVHERRRFEEQVKNKIEAQLSGIDVFQEEQEADMRMRLKDLQFQVKQLQSQETTVRGNETWLKQAAELNGNLKELGDNLVKIADGKTRVGSLKTEEEQRKTAWDNAKEEEKKAGPVIKKVRELDRDIKQFQGEHDRIQETRQKTSDAIEKSEGERKRKVGEQKAAKEKAESNAKYKKAHAADEKLASILSGLNEQYRAAKKQEGEAGDRAQAVKDAQSALEKAQADLKKAEKSLADAEAAKKTANAAEETEKGNLEKILKGRPLHEYENERDLLIENRRLHDKIESLEAERANLADGEACPLCGSKHHPYAEGNVPMPKEIDLKIESVKAVIVAAGKSNGKIQELAKKTARAENDVTKAQGEKAKYDDRCTQLAKALKQAKSEEKKAVGEAKAGFEHVRKELAAFGPFEADAGDVDACFGELESRRVKWEDAVTAEAGARKNVDVLTAEIEGIDKSLKENRKALTGLEADEKANGGRLADAIEQRAKLYGDKNPDAEESRLNAATEKAHGEYEAAQKKRTDAVADLKGSEGAEKTLRKIIGVKSAEVGSKSADVLGDYLPPDVLSRLRDAIAGLLSTAAQNGLSQEQSKAYGDVIGAGLRYVADELKRLGDDLGEKNRGAGSIKTQLETNEKNKEKSAGLRKQRTIQAAELARWDRLHYLIGSADGAKYRKFAQELTFARVVSAANRELAEMSKRYLLIQNKDEPLLLDVVDAYQGGEIRTTKNLSGGESFIVSLALALGLSKMASGKVRVDSLFLDEGFGTLDEESLSTAIDALGSLQAENKLIGVISHVEALKDRIATKIAVTPAGGGRSRLEGPGCSYNG